MNLTCFEFQPKKYFRGQNFRRTRFSAVLSAKMLSDKGTMTLLVTKKRSHPPTLVCYGVENFQIL